MTNKLEIILNIKEAQIEKEEKVKEKIKRVENKRMIIILIKYSC